MCDAVPVGKEAVFNGKSLEPTHLAAKKLYSWIGTLHIFHP